MLILRILIVMMMAILSYAMGLWRDVLLGKFSTCSDLAAMVEYDTAILIGYQDIGWNLKYIPLE